MKRLFPSLVPVLVALLGAGCGSSNGGNSSTVNIDPSMSESAISSAFSTAAAGATLQLAAGTYHFTNSLNLAAKDGITVKGAGPTSTILDFKNQAAGADGVVQTVGAGVNVRVTFQDFGVQDTAGDGIKVTGGNGVHFNRVNVSWPNRTTHGGYGIYPVQSKNVLVENCTVDGASDTGIYVGQSDTIIVRNNTLTNNVAGIEIENSTSSDVTANNSHDNTVGFLVFDLPNLPKVGGKNHRVFGNQFVNNNHPNFGAAGGTVALVPAGTGGAVMASSSVEVFNNTFSGNSAAGFSVISCFVAFSQSDCVPPGATAGYVPVPNNVYAHDNTFTGNGTNPLQGNTDPGHPSYQLAALLASGFQAPGWPGNHVADQTYDGIWPLGDPANSGNPYAVCFKGATSFANLHFDQLNPPSKLLNQTYTFDATKFDCTGTVLPPVTVSNIQ